MHGVLGAGSISRNLTFMDSVYRGPTSPKPGAVPIDWMRWPTWTPWSRPLYSPARPGKKSVKGPSFPYLNREALELRADPVSKKYRDRVRARQAAANRQSGPVAYEMPSLTANQQSWGDARLSGKTHCHGSAGNPSKFFYINRTEQDRRDALLCGQRLDDLPVKVGLQEQAQAWEAGRRQRAGYLERAKKLAALHHNVDPEALANLTEWLSSGVNRGWLSRRVMPNAEHGGNHVMVFVGRKTRKLLGEDKRQRSGAVQLRSAFGDDHYYDNILSGRVSYAKQKGDRSDDCVSKEAKRESEIADRKESGRRAKTKQRVWLDRRRRIVTALSREEWNDLARRAQLGDAAAREAIHRDARLIAMYMAELRCGKQSFVGNGELVNTGLMGSYSERTGQFGSGVEFAIAKWDPNGGGGFKKFFTNAIKWGMDDYLKNLPDELSLHEQPKWSGDDPEDDKGGRRLIDLVVDDDVHDEVIYDYQSWADRLDGWLNESSFSREHVDIFKRYNGLNGDGAKPTFEQIGSELGMSRETARKRHDAVHEYIMQRKAAEQINLKD